jgi:thiol-disulfide isomerase/thioredoxin
MPVVVDFYADWCAPCRTFSPMLDRISKKVERTLAHHAANDGARANGMTADRDRLTADVTDDASNNR